MLIEKSDDGKVSVFSVLQRSLLVIIHMRYDIHAVRFDIHCDTFDWISLEYYLDQTVYGQDY